MPFVVVVVFVFLCFCVFFFIIYQNQCQDPENLSDILKRNLDWAPSKGKRASASEGTSQLNLSSLREAVRVYIREHRPKTPEDVNNLAALRAASYWCWGRPTKLVPGPHDDPRIKEAAEFALKNCWPKELEDKKKELEKRDALSAEKDQSSLEGDISGKVTCTFDYDHRGRILVAQAKTTIRFTLMINLITTNKPVMSITCFVSFRYTG